MRPRSTLILAAVGVGGVAASFSLLPNVNFTLCNANYVQNAKQNCNPADVQSCVWRDNVLLNPNCTDNDQATQVCVYDNGVLTNANRIFLTYPACLRLCGDGWGPWEMDDILFHISTWVIPALVLVFHFHFPPLGWWNIGLVAAHVLGDPIDSLWSLLTRIEIHRRLYNLAVRRRLRSARAIATVWAAYDELNFHDPSGFFFLHLQIKRDSAPELAHFLEIAGNAGQGRVPTWHLHQAAADRSVSSMLWAWIRRKTRPSVQQDLLNRADEAFIEMLSDTERRVLYLIERAAQRLVQNRNSSALGSWLSVFGLMGALIGAYVHTLIEQIQNQTAHTIALVTLLFVVIPIVKLSSNIGAFTSTTAAVDIIQELRAELPAEWALFPELRIPTPDVVASGAVGDVGVVGGGYGYDPAQVQLLHEDSNGGERTRQAQLRTWPHVAAFSGMISSYRPRKVTEQNGPAHAVLLLGVVAFMVLGVCYAPALLISYLAPLKGFACRSLAWTVIAALWVLSASLDLLFSVLHEPQGWRHVVPRWRWLQAGSGKNLWLAISRKDMVITTVITILALAQLIGLYDTCYCRAGEMTHELISYVNLNPLTEDEWNDGWHWWITAPCVSLFVIFSFVGWTEVFVSDSRYLLNRGERDRDEMALHVRKLVPADKSNRLEAPSVSNLSHYSYIGGQPLSR